MARVLIIDDSPTETYKLTTMLEKSGHVVLTAENGEVAKWECEMGSPNQLVRQGWKKEDLPVGTIIRAQANPARADENICSTRRITMDDGTPIFSRPANQ